MQRNRTFPVAQVLYRLLLCFLSFLFCFKLWQYVNFWCTYWTLCLILIYLDDCCANWEGFIVSLILRNGLLLFQQQAAWEKMATSSDTLRRGTLLGTWLLLVEVSETSSVFMLVLTGYFWSAPYCMGRVLCTRNADIRSFDSSSSSFYSFCTGEQVLTYDSPI